MFLLTQAHFIFSLSQMTPDKKQSDFVSWFIENFSKESREITEAIIKNKWCDYHDLKRGF